MERELEQETQTNPASYSSCNRERSIVFTVGEMCAQRSFCRFATAWAFVGSIAFCIVGGNHVMFPLSMVPWEIRYGTGA